MGINGNTQPIAALDAMKFGQALKHVLHQIFQANHQHGPIYLSKIDLADSFYHIDI